MPVGRSSSGQPPRNPWPRGTGGPAVLQPFDGLRHPDRGAEANFLTHDRLWGAAARVTLNRCYTTANYPMLETRHIVMGLLAAASAIAAAMFLWPGKPGSQAD